MTEKIVNPMLANSVPIYFGSDDIHLHFNNKSFVDAQHYIDIASDTAAPHKFDYTRLVKYIEYLDTHDDVYIAMLEEPHLTNNEFNTWMPNNKSKENKLLEEFRTIPQI